MARKISMFGASLIIVDMMLVTFSIAVSDSPDGIKRINLIPGRKTYFDKFLGNFALLEQSQMIRDQKIPSEIFEVYSQLYSLLGSNTQGLTRSSLNSPVFEDSPEEKPGQVSRVLQSDLQTVFARYNVSAECINATSRLINGLGRENWTIQFLDAAGKPGPGVTLGRLWWIGDYRQCHGIRVPDLPLEGSAGFGGQYCTLTAYLVTNLQIKVQEGVCVPDVCTQDEVADLFTAAVYELNLNGTVGIGAVQCLVDQREISAVTIVAIIFVSIIGFLMICGTVFDIIFIQRLSWKAKAEEEDHVYLFNPQDVMDGGSSEIGIRREEETAASLGNYHNVQKNPNSMSFWTKVLLAFSVYTNGSKVLNCSQPPGSLGAIHGIRFLSMSWVILGHIYNLGIYFAINVLDEGPVIMKRWTFDAITNALVSVDTFFTLSGLLTSYLTVKEMKKRGWRINWGLYIFHRFWRLTPPYMLVLLIYLGFMQYMGSGPLWPQMTPTDKEFCETNWWTNLLYINNFVHLEEACFGHTWYLANDMQFFWLSPFMIIPLYFHAYLGVTSCSVFLLAHWITTGVLSNYHNWPPTVANVLFAGESPNSWMVDYYVKPWCRIGPYVVGILAGMLLASRRKIRLPWYLVTLGWAVATAVALAVLYGLRGDISREHISSVGVAAFYNTMARSAWGACICWVIVACVWGYGGPVNTLLSWSPFVVLGRLTYMAYLIHPPILEIYYQNMERLFYVTDTSVVVIFCGILLITYVISFVLMLAFESPMIGLEKTFLRKERKG